MWRGVWRVCCNFSALYVGAFVAGVLIVSVWSMWSGWSEISLAGNDDSKSYAEATVAVGGGNCLLWCTKLRWRVLSWM